MTYKCPYCYTTCFDDGTITKRVYESYEHSGILNVSENDTGCVVLELSKCPQCGKVAFKLSSHFKSPDKIAPYSYPPVDMILLPSYIPQFICADYIEAVSIVDASPKASATLSRRCLQGMIHDFWGIKKGRLVDEIKELQAKVPPAQWSAIDALRKIGNIGAHMEKDVNLIVDIEPSEAKSLLKLIELLIDKWYSARYDEETLLSEITKMAEEKELLRKPGVSNSNSK